MTPQRFAGLDKDAQLIVSAWEVHYDAIVQAAFSSLRTSNSDRGLPLLALDGATPQMLLTALESLVDELRTSVPSKRRDALADTMCRLVHSGSVESAVLHECSRTQVRQLWRDAISTLFSLPSKVANILGKSTPDELFPKRFSHLMFSKAAQCVAFLSGTSDFNCLPLSLFLSRLLVDFRSDEPDSGMANFLEVVVSWCSESDRARRVLEPVLFNLEASAVTSVAAPLLLVCANLNVNPAKVLGESALDSPDWKHVLCTRLPLLQYGGTLNYVTLQTLALYLRSTVKGNERLPALASELLSVWGDRSALQHTPLEQHTYVTHGVVLMVRALVASNVGKRNALLMQLFEGVPLHLDSPLPQIRALGMITAEVLAGLLGEQKLEFSYDGFSDECRAIVEDIRSLDLPLALEAKPTDGDALMNKWVKRCSEEKHEVVNPPVKREAVVERSELKDSDSESEVDSDDDDFEPYDMSCDVPLSETKRPAYIRDALEGLAEVDDRDKWTMSLVSIADLAEKQLPNEDKSLALELLEVLICLEQKFPVNDFEIVSKTSAVAVVCACPEACAEFLAKKFHSERGSYSIAQRFFMLDVLSEAAVTLSQPKAQEKADIRHAKPESKDTQTPLENVLMSEVIEEFSDLLNRDIEAGPAAWRDLVDGRVAKKMRRFASATKRVEGTASRFAPVADSFFFPLLRGLSQSLGTVALTLQPQDHVDDDNALVTRFLQVLATVMRCAVNAVAAPRMARELLDLAWSVRFSKEASVRLAVVSCVLSVLLSVPASRLRADLLPALLEAREWLVGAACGSIRQQDPDTNVRTLSAQTGALLDKILSQSENP